MKSANYRTKIKGQTIPTFSTVHSPLFTTYRAFTLIELLVVMSIMVLLVAVSVPMLKPMFESQKTKNAAQTVAAALQRVRFRAMEERKTYGISFAPFENNQNVAVQMRLVKMGNAFLNSSQHRIQVFEGNIHFYHYDSGDWIKESIATEPAWAEWNQHAQPGYEIQLGRQGRLYKLGSLTQLDPTQFYGELTLPESADGSSSPVTDVLEYKIVQPPRSSLSPPVVLPRGTIIDLAYSSGCIAPENSGDYDANKLYFNGSIQNILFTPNGYIDYFNGNYSPYYGGLIYFCIGEWERGLNLAEDGKNNIETMTNFWVTLNPKTGQVRITEMAPHDSDPTKPPIENARKFAAEHYGVGE